MRPRFLIAIFAFIVLSQHSLIAATFVVPEDREMVRRASAIALATAMPSYAEDNGEGGVETVTPFAVSEVIKGRLGENVTVAEPGGTLNGVSQVLAGVPRFETGDRVLLFLSPIGGDRWAVTELVLGKFKFVTDETGQSLLLRDADEIVGWDPDLKVHVERRRLAAPFLDFVRTEAKGGMGQANYVEPTAASTSRFPSQTSRTGAATTLVAPYTATSYTMIVSGSMGSRWNVFPSAVSWFANASGEPGAPGNGVTAVQAGLAAWDNDCPSNVNYVYGGTDSTHTSGLHATDGANTVLWERDLSSWGISPFTCSSSGYSGTLGIGGVTSASGSNTLGGETFLTTQEADVEMNKGLANCTLLFSSGDFSSAVTHELGHTLGFRHSDQTRSGSAACSTDPSLECSSSAIMTAFVTHGLNAALQTWDQHAVQAVYPGGSCTTCTPSAITGQPQSVTIPPGGSTTLTVTATGTGPLSYQWYVGASGNTSTPISEGTGPSLTQRPTATVSYWVRVSNACGSVNSATTTITVSGTCSPPAIRSEPRSTTIPPGGSTTLSVTASGTALQYQWYVGASGNTSTPISEGTGPSLTQHPASAVSYWVRVFNACGSVNSTTATITVSSSCTPPAITSQPQSTTIQAGASAVLTVSASGTGPVYQWYVGASGNTSTPITEGTEASFTARPTATVSFWVRVTNGCGSVDSATATVTVTGTCSPPVITSQPQSTTIPRGGSAVLSVSASGTGLVYQWYVGASGSTSTPISEGTGPSITQRPTATVSYWVRVSNACGFVNSATATVTVQ
ncbi:MAG TPA: hypothetical protein VF381_02220 [Thermoanaerobaculia bacterium]